MESIDSKEIIDYLKKEYTESWMYSYKADAVYDYVDEAEADIYGDGDYEEAYDNLCTGDAIEHDIMTMMEEDIKKKFEVDVYSEDSDELLHIRGCMEELVGAVFIGFG
jgi:hypothetical protein